jgi:hypothetical protein
MSTLGAELVDRCVQVLDHAEMVVPIPDFPVIGADLLRWTSTAKEQQEQA